MKNGWENLKSCQKKIGNNIYFYVENQLKNVGDTPIFTKIVWIQTDTVLITKLLKLWENVKATGIFETNIKF